LLPNKIQVLKLMPKEAKPNDIYIENFSDFKKQAFK
jgi:hypothetical protein